MKPGMMALVLLAGLAAAPAAYGQDHSSGDAGMEARSGMMQMHEGQSMINQAGMMRMHAGSPMMLLGQKEVLGLDASQIQRLEALAGKVSEMRLAQMESMKNLHSDALTVLTDEQRAQVDHAMMGNGMMGNGMAIKGEDEGMPCPMAGQGKAKEGS